MVSGSNKPTPFPSIFFMTGAACCGCFISFGYSWNCAMLISLCVSIGPITRWLELSVVRLAFPRRLQPMRRPHQQAQLEPAQVEPRQGDRKQAFAPVPLGFVRRQ